MTDRAGHCVRRAFLLAPLLVAGSVWPAAGAGSSLEAYPVPVVIEGEGTYRPDMQVGHSHGGPFVGDDTYDAGPDQTVEEVVSRGERTFVVFKVENDGEVDDRFVLSGPGDRGGLVARYRSAGEDVTAEVVHARYSIGLAPGSFRLLQLRVHASADTERGLVRRWVVTATSEGEPDRADAARAVFRVRH